ncbi:MAG: hypothetical protein AVDCRST_MAG20-2874 [uncultured Acidimicrobiales bacterium]|uniref:DUF4190 domain-containing protein n=1 Tax=uncultured Acidimicrobiales bacterium TaxID=310071 RepID=A0A6J4IXN5_9ACTN|nr:MAG: hypothetical protein AVDCRST_MAG20-2874 [uncultured Acidimicrobiales bacterium]
MSDQPPHDRPDQGGAPYQAPGGGDGPPPGGAWSEPSQGQPPYSQPYGQPYGAPPKNGMGTAALVLGIIAVVLSVLFFPLGILLGIVAAVLGYLGRKKAARREATNRGQATAGLVLGLVAVLVGGLIAAFVGNFLAENSDEIGDLSECLEDAGTTEEQTACRDEFEDELTG